jgi:hypothetical protein
MRTDMAKVIVERPRVGSRLPSRKKGYRKFLQKTAVENLPTREPLLGHWRGKGRWLNEHLGPMRRFLRSNVGRPWNKVHQELCEHVSFDNPVQSHVLSHVFDFVQQHVEVRDRQVFSLQRCYWRGGRALTPGTMYICPATGLLKLVRAGAPNPPPQRAGLGKLIQYHRRDDQWWELKMQPLTKSAVVVRRHAAWRPRPGVAGTWDVWLERIVSLAKEDEVIALYGGKFAAVSKRLLSVAESHAIQRRLGKKHRRS